MLLYIHGEDAISPFRRQELINKLSPLLGRLHGCKVQYVYGVELVAKLNSFQRQRLSLLLREQTSVATPQDDLFLVIPRFGTLSPWSSKANDIARNCGFTSIKRIERGIAYYLQGTQPLNTAASVAIAALLHDPMTESVVRSLAEITPLFELAPAKPLQSIDILQQGLSALITANEQLGLALTPEEMAYLLQYYQDLRRNPTDVELMSFAQVNSEHCRHKVFNAQFVVDGREQALSLFDMIRNTHRCSPQGTLSAYQDNAAVMEGSPAVRFFPHPDTGIYQDYEEMAHILLKVETHNHPTAIAPFPGAATGAGGEIRDEAATGRGAKPKAGLCGFSVSNLRLPGAVQPWEINDPGKPARIVSALQIMLEGPIGAASFNNEFGRPGLGGYFRTYEFAVPGTQIIRGYHKPIMLAGGLGQIRESHIKKATIPPGTPLIVLGGPALLIGLGGGAASSLASGQSRVALDFASVQRSNPEMQRRAQEVIDRCWALGADNPIISIHDVGAGGLSNALLELVHDSGRGGLFQLRQIPNDDPGMSPLQIWCNEAQERYVLAVPEQALSLFEAICQRERCPYAVVGQATTEPHIVLEDALFDNQAMAISAQVFLGKPPRQVRHTQQQKFASAPFDATGIEFEQALERVLRLPAVADKRFLIHIGDRSITGLVQRDQCVGPWQVAVADVAVTLADYRGFAGEAMAMGERTPLAVANPQAAARMAVGEALTNLAAADIADLHSVKLSANWMVAAQFPGDDAALYSAVAAIGIELCPQLGLSIPVGKDSMSMQTLWQDGPQKKQVIAPISVIISAFAKVGDCRQTVTPQLQWHAGDSQLILLDLGQGLQRLGGSSLAQVHTQYGGETPDVVDAAQLKAFFKCIQKLKQMGLVLAYHDRSDGGLLVCLLEMAFAAHCGLEIDISALGAAVLPLLFTEELGAVIQIPQAQAAQVQAILKAHGLANHAHVLGRPVVGEHILIHHQGRRLFADTRSRLQGIWTETAWRIQSLRDNPRCAQQEYDSIVAENNPGLSPRVTFDMTEVPAPYISNAKKPRLAVLREQGVNGQMEMAAAFSQAGFECQDVHMSDILEGRVTLASFQGLAACGGFSYGDVLGAGRAWAQSILFNEWAREQFSEFFSRPDTFALGVCNGCQMMSQLKEIIPGAEHWPRFIRNISASFEARFSLVEICPSPSVLTQGMVGSYLPIPVAHGEGCVAFDSEAQRRYGEEQGLIAMRFVDHHGQVTENYPANPNGSAGGITALTTLDGRFTIMMPHPERVFRTVQMSWAPREWPQEGPWMRMFRNARRWIG